MPADKIAPYLGAWKCQVWYPNRDDDGEEHTVNRMIARADGDEVVLTSLPNDEGSYMVIRLEAVDENVVTGRWHEMTSPTGRYAGAMYSGAGQFIVDEDKEHLEGLWSGVGYDHNLSKLRIYPGRWQLDRIK